MNIRRYILSVLITLCSMLSHAQADHANLPNSVKARFQINDIKGRGIIVRLRTNKDKLEAYRKEGYNKIADKLEEKSRITNLLLIYAFVAKWTYGPVYFMESQYTNDLMMHDTLRCRAYDLERDTAIYVRRDSFYIVDFGDLMATEPLNPNTTYKDIDKTKQSSQPAGGSYLVAKDAQQNQLQSPMPFFQKIMFDDLTTTAAMEPVVIPQGLADTMSGYLHQYATINDLIKSDAKNTLARYLTLLYNHIVNTAAGNRYERGVEKFNKGFIDYYCKRLDKDRNITCNDEPYYWWLRNPNIQYLPALPQIERRLKSYMDKDPKFIKTY